MKLSDSDIQGYFEFVKLTLFRLQLGLVSLIVLSDSIKSHRRMQHL